MTLTAADFDLNARWGGILVEDGGSLTTTDAGGAVTVKEALVGITVEENATADLTGTSLRNNTTGVVAAGDLTADNIFVEGAATGVLVYEPGTASITDSEIRDGGYGLDVRSAAGTTLDNTLVTTNTEGVRAGFIDCYGATCPCFTGCRSTLTLQNGTRVNGNNGWGMILAGADVSVTNSEISQNGNNDPFGKGGLTVSNSTVFPFRFNLVVGNGNAVTGLGPGAFVSAAGDLRLSPQNEEGRNRVAHSAAEELYVYASGDAFLGDAFDNGHNAVFDAQGGVLVRNPTKPVVEADYVYWGTGGAPAPGALAGFVSAAAPLPCDPVSPPDPDDPAPCSGSRHAGSGFTAPSGEAAERGGLGAVIRAIRAAIAADPSGVEAAGLVRRLAVLHRRDRADAEGEHAASFALLRMLRGRLSRPSLPEGLRATAEAALEAVAVDALTRERYEEAAGEVQAWQEYVEAPGVLRVLALVEGSLEAHAGRYAEAAALAQAVAESEEDATAVQGLTALAEYYAGRASGGAERGSGVAPAASLGARRTTSSSGVSEAGLAVYPNPVGESAAATVALMLDAASDVRVAVYDVLGRSVATLHSGELGAGEHAFSLDGEALPTGVYIVRVEGGARSSTARLTVVR